jgi:hypothetical protein
MEFITKVKELEGKTVKKASFVDCDESVALIFTDDTCAFFDVSMYGDSHDIVLISDPDDYLKRDAGIISEAEYKVIQDREEADHKAAATERELKQLAMLKSKYEA